MIISDISGAHNSKNKYCYNAKHSAYHLYVKTKISVDFQICISVPLTWENMQNLLKIRSQKILVFFIEQVNL